MKRNMLSVLLVINLFLSALVIPVSVPVFQGEVYASNFPTFMSGSEAKIKSNINKKGKGTLNIMSLVGVLICAGCMIWGAIKLASNNPDGAKGYLFGGGAALLIIALTYSLVVFYGKL